MKITWDPVTMVNIILCLTITILGYLCYKKTRDSVSLSIGIAFGIFGVSHALSFLGFGNSLMSIVVIVRVIAYMIVVFALFKVVIRR